MNNYELEKSIISAILQDFDKAQSTYLQAEWFTEPNFKTIFEILNNYGSRLDGLMELFAKEIGRASCRERVFRAV